MINTLSTHCTLSKSKAEMIASFRHVNCRVFSESLKAWKLMTRASTSLWLQAELQLARYSDCLAHLPFLDQLLTQDGMSVQEGHIMQTLAQRAVAILDSAEDDVVFCYGVSAVKIMTAVELKAQATTGHEIMKPWEAVISHVKPWRHDTPWYSTCNATKFASRSIQKLSVLRL